MIELEVELVCIEVFRFCVEVRMIFFCFSILFCFVFFDMLDLCILYGRLDEYVYLFFVWFCLCIFMIICIGYFCFFLVVIGNF